MAAGRLTPLLIAAFLLAPSAAEEGDLERARRLDERAQHLFERGEPRAAVKPATEALRLYKRIHGPDHLRVASALNRLGRLYLELTEPAPAGPLLKRALAIRRRHLPSLHKDMAVSHNNLGGFYNKVGRYDEAIDHLRRALDDRYL